MDEADNYHARLGLGWWARGSAGEIVELLTVLPYVLSGGQDQYISPSPKPPWTL